MSILDEVALYEGTVGYSTHGKWVPAKEIYEIEDERGNTVDEILLNDKLVAIWVTRNPKDAVRYNRTEDEEDDEITQDDIDELEIIDLTNAKHVKSMDDGDGGEVWIKEK